MNVARTLQRPFQPTLQVCGVRTSVFRTALLTKPNWLIPGLSHSKTIWPHGADPKCTNVQKSALKSKAWTREFQLSAALFPLHLKRKRDFMSLKEKNKSDTNRPWHHHCSVQAPRRLRRSPQAVPALPKHGAPGPGAKPHADAK